MTHCYQPCAVIPYRGILSIIMVPDWPYAAHMVTMPNFISCLSISLRSVAISMPPVPPRGCFVDFKQVNIINS